MPTLEVARDRGTPFKIHYEVEGTGTHKLVMVMGMSASLAAWQFQRCFFARIPSLSVLYLDNRGAGHSECPKISSFSSSECAKDILEVIDHLGWQKFSIVGVSMGGMISLELALLALERVESLVLGVTHTGGWSSVPSFGAVYGMIQSALTKKLEDRVHLSIRRTHSSAWLDQMRSDGRTNREFIFENKMKSIVNTPPQSFRGFLGHSRIVFTHKVRQDRLEQLKQSNVPVFVVTGTDDSLVNPSNSYALKDFLGCEFAEWTGAGHAIHSECADQLNQLIVNHLHRWCGLELDPASASSDSM